MENDNFILARDFEQICPTKTSNISDEQRIAIILLAVSREIPLSPLAQWDVMDYFGISAPKAMEIWDMPDPCQLANLLFEYAKGAFPEVEVDQTIGEAAA